jgi:hypothetical protein
MRRLTLIATLVAVLAPTPGARAPAQAPAKPRHPVAHTARSSWS